MLPSANSSTTPNAPAASDLSEVNSTPKSNQHKSATKLPESRSANQKDAAGDFMAMKPTLIDRSSSVANATKDGQGRLRAKPGQWLVLRQQDFSPATADKSLDSDTIVLAQRRSMKYRSDANEKSDSEDDVPLAKRAR